MSVFGELQVKLSEGHKFDRDVELLIYYKDAHQPTAVVEAGAASAKPGEFRKLWNCYFAITALHNDT